MEEKFINKIIEIAKALKVENLTRIGDTLSFRYKEGIIINKKDTDMGNLLAKDFTFVSKGDPMNATEALHMAIMGYKKEANAIIFNRAPYCSIVGDTRTKLPAVLDDFAQIVGYTAKVSSSENVVDILSALKGRNACLVKNGASIAVGRTLEEAFTGVMVLEKGAKAYVESTILGNPVKIGFLDAILMNIIYKKKYSKKNQERLKEKINSND